MSDLKKCPFCGGEARHAKMEIDFRGEPNAWFADGTPATVQHYVNCVKCGANSLGLVGDQTREEASEEWNRRDGEEKLKAENEGLRKEIEYERKSYGVLMDNKLNLMQKVEKSEKLCKVYQGRCDKLSNENSQLRHQLKKEQGE